MDDSRMTRRGFLCLGSTSLGAVVLAACGAQQPAASTEAERTEAPEPTAAPEPATAETSATAGAVSETGGEERVIVGDVTDYALEGDWPGAFGWVTFQLHEGFVDGEKAYFIRTDASEQAFAEEHGLVYVPLLAGAKNAPNAAANLYLFESGVSEQLPVMSTHPGKENYSPLWRVHLVSANGDSVYDSESALQEAADAGDVTIADQEIFVNYPVVKWVDGELAMDEAKEEALGSGQLIEPVDTENMRVTFKLHQCFPGSRYILTDTSAAPMAPMMSVPASSPTQELKDVNATDRIWVFANGIEGSSVMGFQPAIFAHEAGHAAWSPFWDHYVLRWKDDAEPRVLRSAAEVQEALQAGEVEEFAGTPDTHPNGFVVNCPAPLLAPNTFTG